MVEKDRDNRPILVLSSDLGKQRNSYYMQDQREQYRARAILQIFHGLNLFPRAAIVSGDTQDIPALNVFLVYCLSRNLVSLELQHISGQLTKSQGHHCYNYSFAFPTRGQTIAARGSCPIGKGVGPANCADLCPVLSFLCTMYPSRYCCIVGMDRVPDLEELQVASSFLFRKTSLFGATTPPQRHFFN